MKTCVSKIITLVCLAFFGCVGQHYDFETAFRRANDSYFGPSRSEAEHGLTVFLMTAERNEATARHDGGLDYDRTLGMSWLKLWSTYNAAGDVDHASMALNNAI